MSDKLFFYSKSKVQTLSIYSDNIIAKTNSCLRSKRNIELTDLIILSEDTKI